MKRMRTILIILISMILLVAFSSTVKAAGEVEMTLNSSSKLTKGGTVELILSTTKIDAGEGINAILAKLKYDTDIFELIKNENYEDNLERCWKRLECISIWRSQGKVYSSKK